MQCGMRRLSNSLSTGLRTVFVVNADAHRDWAYGAHNRGAQLRGARAGSNVREMASRTVGSTVALPARMSSTMWRRARAVSYTHLTLPTILLV